MATVPAKQLPPMHLPLSGISFTQLGASIGQKTNPVLKARVTHNGLDIIVPSGTPVYASGYGTVVNVEKSNMVDARRLKLMKPTAMLINTARGPLVDEAALAQALKSGQLMAAGIDVMSKEPPAADNPLLAVDNCYITPHIAWASKEARVRLLDVVTANLKAYLAGKPVNVVSP